MLGRYDVRRRIRPRLASAANAVGRQARQGGGILLFPKPFFENLDFEKGYKSVVIPVLYRLSTPWIEDCRTAPLFDSTEKDHCDLRAMPVRQPGMWYLERENSDGRIKRREFLGLLAGAGRRQHMSRHLLLISLIV